MNKFIDFIIAFSLKKKHLILCLTVVLAIVGCFCFKETPVDAFPDVTNTKVTIITQWPGRSAEEIEKFVTIPIEIAMNAAQEKTDIRSTTLFGLSVVTVLFDDYANDEFARQQVFNLIKDTTGVTPTCFRFPGGSINSYNKAVYKDIKAEMIRRGFVPYDWNVSSGDASTTKYTPEQLTGYVLNGIGSKSRIIVLMHDSSSKENTAQAVRQIIIGIREKGFIFAPLDYQTKPILF